MEDYDDFERQLKENRGGFAIKVLSYICMSVLGHGKTSDFNKTFLPYASSPYYLFYLFSPVSLGDDTKMTHKGWRVVKPQHNQSHFLRGGLISI